MVLCNVGKARCEGLQDHLGYAPENQIRNGELAAVVPREVPDEGRAQRPIQDRAGVVETLDQIARAAPGHYVRFGFQCSRVNDTRRIRRWDRLDRRDGVLEIPAQRVLLWRAHACSIVAHRLGQVAEVLRSAQREEPLQALAALGW